MVKVAINGFGRTGRLALRAALERGSKLEFVAVNRGDAKLLGHLLKFDSVHGRAPFPVEVEGDTIMAAGKRIKVLNESDAEKLPWGNLVFGWLSMPRTSTGTERAQVSTLRRGRARSSSAPPGRS